ncbi:MAG: lysylphosphatidylglycerol synthase transmembrane domain-containing protein [Minisyncoccales bacterium]
MGKKRNTIVSVLIGLIIFGFFLYHVGIEAILLIINNINFFYLGVYGFFTSMVFVLWTIRWQIILYGYGKKPGFFKLLKQTIAGYSIAYITPTIRLGGEPLRAFMLKREAGIDYKTGSSSIIIDKFIEFLGTIIFGIIGLFFVFTLKIDILLKLIFTSLILIAIIILAVFYYRSLKGKGSFSSLFNFLRLSKIKKFQGFDKTLIEVEKQIESFFKNHKKYFFLSLLSYLIYTLIVFFETKFLLLSFGIETNIVEVILILTIIGLIAFIPVPAGLGFLEGSQSGLFHLLRGQGSIGFAFSLLGRIRAIIFVAIGFGLITYFSGNQIKQKFKQQYKKI